MKTHTSHILSSVFSGGNQESKAADSPQVHKAKFQLKGEAAGLKVYKKHMRLGIHIEVVTN